jgi:hypothetical protein
MRPILNIVQPVKTMWIPTPIYERIPQFWLLLGLLFMSSGTYLGFDYKLSFLYFAVGFACCVWSLSIFTMRLKHRGQASQPEDSEQSEPAEEPQNDTAELA